MERGRRALWLGVAVAAVLLGLRRFRRAPITETTGTDAATIPSVVEGTSGSPPAPPPARPSREHTTPRWRWRAVALLLLGPLLLATSFGLFLRVRRSPEQPSIDGRAYLYVDTPTVDANLLLTLTNGNRFGADPPARYDILIGETEKPVRWALVLSGDARLRDDVGSATSPGVTVTRTRVASPPFGGRPEAVQIIHGETRAGLFSGTGDISFVAGRLRRPVARIVEARRTLVLPQVGRAVPVFASPARPLPIGVDGSWYIPEKFEASVDIGPRPLEHRVDLVAPNLADQAAYRWTSSVSVRPVLAVTDTGQERVEEIVVFLLGVLSAAGLEVLLLSLHRWGSGTRRERLTERAR